MVSIFLTLIPVALIFWLMANADACGKISQKSLSPFKK